MFFFWGVFYSYGQDTIIIYNDFRHKVGVKLMSHQSYDASLSPNKTQVYNTGVLLMWRIKQSRFSIEAGVYYYNTAMHYNIISIYNRNVSIPLYLRYDTKLIYLSGGIYGSSLLETTTKKYIDPRTNYDEERKINVGVSLTVGVEKQISRRVNLFTEGNIMSNITSSKKQSDLWEQSYVNLGFAFGVSYVLTITHQ